MGDDRNASQPRRILIIRLSAIGDVVMASGMIRALRRAHPDAGIYWLAQSGPAELLEANTELDGVIVWPLAEWRRLWRERRWWDLFRAARGFVGQLRGYQFDWALDAHGLLKSGLWTRLSGASYRVGLGSREGSQWLMTRVVARDPDDRRFGSEYIELMRAIGAAPAAFEPHIAVADVDRKCARDGLADRSINDDYMVFAPFTTRPQKHWFEDYWMQLAQQLAAHYPWPIVVLGGSADVEAAERLVEASAVPTVHLAGVTTLRESMAIVAGARLLVGVDTGLTHMGTAAGVPTIALFGATRPYTRPGVASTRILFEPLPCAPCRFSPVCDGRFTCMRALTPTAVCDTALVLLGEASS